MRRCGALVVEIRRRSWRGTRRNNIILLALLIYAFGTEGLCCPLLSTSSTAAASSPVVIKFLSRTAQVQQDQNPGGDWRPHLYRKPRLETVCPRGQKQNPRQTRLMCLYPQFNAPWIKYARQLSSIQLLQNTMEGDFLLTFPPFPFPTFGNLNFLHFIWMH